MRTRIALVLLFLLPLPGSRVGPAPTPAVESDRGNPSFGAPAKDRHVSDTAFVERSSGPPVFQELGVPRSCAALTSLVGRAYRGSGRLSRLASGFDMDHRVGDLTVPAVRWSDDGFRTIERLFHEWFHVVQGRRFGATRGAGTLRSQVERHLPSGAISAPRFRARADVERRLLRAALSASEEDRRRQILRSYLAVRSRRMETAPGEVRRAEINIERKEGSAQYVGVAAAALAAGAGAVGYPPEGDQADDLADSALARYGYAEVLRRERARGGGARAEDPVASALASGPVKLVVELRPEDPRTVSGMRAESHGGFAQEVEPGLMLSRNPASFELALAGVEVTVQDAPVVLDVRSAPDTVRLVAALPGLPAFDGAAAEEGEAAWPDGLSVASDVLRLRVDGPARTWIGPDSIVVRAAP